jgi:hypothetical protein
VKLTLMNVHPIHASIRENATIISMDISVIVCRASTGRTVRLILMSASPIPVEIKECVWTK